MPQPLSANHHVSPEEFRDACGVLERVRSVEFDDDLLSHELAHELRAVSRAVSTVALYGGGVRILGDVIPQDSMLQNFKVYMQHESSKSFPVNVPDYARKISIFPQESVVHSRGAAVRLDLQIPELVAPQWRTQAYVVLPTDRVIINELEDPARLHERESIVASSQESDRSYPFDIMRLDSTAPARYLGVLQEACSAVLEAAGVENTYSQQR